MKMLFTFAMVAFLGYTYYVFNGSERELAQNRRVIAELAERLERVWADELVADVLVNKLETNPLSGEREMHLTFVQYQSGTREPLFEKSMVLRGNEFYVDALVAKFERGFVEHDDPLRGKSLLLFRRAFGNQEKPDDGVLLHRGFGEVMIPEHVQVDTVPSRFEEELWQHFWELANDREQAVASGLAVIQGEAPHMKAVEGQVYKLTLRASGGLNMVPRLPAAVLRRKNRAANEVSL